MYRFQNTVSKRLQNFCLYFGYSLCFKKIKTIANNKDHTCLSQERLTTLIREIFREEFEKQQKNVLNLISGNLEITMKEIKSIKTEMNDLKKSLEFIENVLEEKV